MRNEYEELFHNERPKLVETIAWAASNGDRSENADYIYGKRRLREIDRRLRILRKRMEAAEVVDPATIKSNKVVFGATVTIEDEHGQSRTIQIVGEDEIDVEKGKISWKSPLSTALIGKVEGDEITVRRPKGDLLAEIRAIKYI